MKTLIQLCLALTSPLWATAQLVTMDVYFSNIGLGVNAPIYNLDGVTALEGPGYSVELTYESGGAQVPVSPPAQFLSGGYFSDGIRSITAFKAGDTVALHLQAWDNAAGTVDFFQAALRGFSATVYLTVPTPASPGSPPNLPLPLAGLESFSLAVPEPAEGAIVLGLFCLSAGLVRNLVRARRAP